MVSYYDEEQYRRRRAQRQAKLRRQRKIRERRRRLLILCCFCIGIMLLLIVVIRAFSGSREKKEAAEMTEAANETEFADSPETAGKEESEQGPSGDGAVLYGQLNDAAGFLLAGILSKGAALLDNLELKEKMPFAEGYLLEETDDTVWIGDENVLSTYAILVDLDEDIVVAKKNAYDRISPASMTKILTVLVAAEHILDLEDTFTITKDITDYSFKNDCSAVGFDVGETVTVRDLFYGTVLPSGGDAAAGLAYYVSGSLDGFVDLMNGKLSELGIDETAHFTNCVGLYDANHYCSAYDMAVILKAAVENELCREVLSEHIYTTSATGQHPEGIEISNWFLRKIEDKETYGEVVCGKTGYVVQSGNCAASYYVSDSGKHYICVTADAYNGWRCIYDHVAVYQEYTK